MEHSLKVAWLAVALICRPAADKDVLTALITGHPCRARPGSMTGGCGRRHQPQASWKTAVPARGRVRQGSLPGPQTEPAPRPGTGLSAAAAVAAEYEHRTRSRVPRP